MISSTITARIAFRALSTSTFDRPVPSAAFRYCLGRRTYIVSDCCDWLVTNWENFQKFTKGVIRGDLEWAFDEDDRDRAEKRKHKKLGMDIDRQQWERVRALWNDKF